MKILYLHGLRERNSVVLNFLKTLPCEVTAPMLDPYKPAETLKRISEIQADYIIGFSLGGYFASRIITTTPKLLINPALCFPDILEARRSKDPVTAEYKNLQPYLGNKIQAIFTTEDYKIGLRSLPIYKEVYPGSQIIYIPGGHNPGEEIKEKITNIIFHLPLSVY